MTHRILVTGVGAIIGYGIINSLRQTDLPLRIYGTDIFPDAYGGSLADHFIPGVKAYSEDYLSFIESTVKEHAIDLIIPGIEQDLYSLAEKKARIPTRIVLNNELCLRLSKNKLHTYEHFRALDQPFVIPTLHDRSYDECVAELGSPFILKPYSSYASKGLEIIRSREDFEFFSARQERQCVYQRLVGSDDSEYTVGVFGDGAGGYLDSLILRRTLSKEGATSKAWLVPADPAITECVNVICQLLAPIGPTNIQLRKEGEKVFLLEINPRISSSCSIRSAMGYNEPELCVRHYLLGEAIVPAPKRPASVVRYIADHVSFTSPGAR
ncbi:ATP-grasp domain-containing protein [soil metagenome]